MDAAAALAAGGILNPGLTVSAAQAVGLPLALACAVLQQESAGGNNVWGHDPVENRGVYTPGSPVTEQAYRQYKILADRGEIGRQGVGPMQLTSRWFQDAADARGGCWDPAANMAAGFTGLVTLVNRYGLPAGVAAYNGSGPAAERYRDQVLQRYRTWITRLAAAPEDDVQPDERAALMEVRDNIRLTKPGVRLPGRGAVMPALTDDQYGWVLNSAGKAADALAEVQQLRTDLADGKFFDYAELARQIIAQLAKPS